MAIVSLVESAIIGLSISTILYTIIGLLPINFNLWAKVFFICQSILLARGIREIFKLKPFKIPKITPLGIIFIAVILKMMIFTIIRPIVDPDVTNSYLPFAQSTHLKSHIPTDTVLTREPMVVPPPGGWILFSVAMAVTNNPRTQAFKALPILHYLLFFAMNYFLCKEIFGKKLATLSSLVFTFLPFNDEFLMTFALYPEILFSALFVFIYRKSTQLLTTSSGISAGLALTTSFLLKFQGIFYYPIFFFLILSNKLTQRAKTLALAALVVTFIIFTIRPTIYTSASFALPNNVITVILSLAVILLGNILHRKKIIGQNITKRVIIILGISSLLGFTWIIRNQIIYRVPFSDARPSTIPVHEVSQILNREPVSQSQKHSELAAPILLKSFGSLFLIPKALGLLVLLLPQYLNGFVLVSFMWYWIWILFMGSTASSRYLLPLVPLICIAVGLGAQFISRKLKVSAQYIVILLGLLSLTQSLLISWNMGISVLGYSKLKALASAASTGSEITRNLTLKDYANVLLASLNSGEETFILHARTQILISTLLFIFIVIFLKFSHLQKLSVKAALLISITYIFPYGLIVHSISGGNPLKFAQNEKLKVYNYWGLTNRVIPTLSTFTDQDSRIIVFGPRVPVSDETNLATINIDSGFGIRDLSAILTEKEPANVAKFLKDQKFKAFILDGHDAYLKRFELLKKTYPPFSIFQDTTYFSRVMSPSDDSTWYLYIIK